MSTPVEKAQAVLKHHRYEVPDHILSLALIAAQTPDPVVTYKEGDFVELYGGMGNVYWGEVMGPNGRGGYRINMWDEGEEAFTHISEREEISKLSSKEEAREYFLAMTKGRRPKG